MKLSKFKVYLGDRTLEYFAEEENRQQMLDALLQSYCSGDSRTSQAMKLTVQTSYCSAFLPLESKGLRIPIIAFCSEKTLYPSEVEVDAAA